jgi:sugar O-acyltransferase (sialic acid O-acetyltransferase NeuD family)
VELGVVKQILIVGAGGHGKEVATYVRALRTCDGAAVVRGFIDDHRPQGPFAEVDVLGGIDDLQAFLREHADTDFHYITAVGDNRVRANLVRRVEGLAAPNLTTWTVRHPTATIGPRAEIGAGTCLAPGSILTTDVEIGEHCILNVKASVSHDSTVGRFTNVNPGAVICGNVRIGEGAYIGAGATVIEKVSIGEWTVIGAGAVVVEDIPPHVTAVGVPARVIKRHGSSS